MLGTLVVGLAARPADAEDGAAQPDAPTQESPTQNLPAQDPAAQESPATATSQDRAGELRAQLKSATQKVAGEQTYSLRYKFQPGEVAHWRVVQLITVDTKIRGAEQVAKTRSVSTKMWTVRSVDEAGNITFVHQVDDADMWQSTSGAKEVHYNSRVHPTAPREYAMVATSVGRPLATITLSPSGQILKRDSQQANFSPSSSELAIPLPEQAVRVGTKWNRPDEVRVRLEDGRVQRVQTRQVFTLEKVETGIATISVRTEVLTPISEPKVQAQLVQKLLNGSVKFDLDAGRLRSKQIDLDETVIGFSGADSVMQYLARFTEEQVSAEEAERAAESVAASARQAKPVAAKPKIVRAPVVVADSKGSGAKQRELAGETRK